MDLWVDLDSGTFGMSESIVVVSMSAEEAEEFGKCSDSERIRLARLMNTGLEYQEAMDELL